MNISVIGAGNIASTLGKKWVEAGHRLTFGVREPANDKYAPLSAIGQISSIVDALNNAEIVLLALPGSVVADFASEYGASLAGKIVLDATNNPRSSTMNNLEILQAQAPGAYLVRAFSTLGWENFADPQIGGVQIDLFYCGHGSAQAVVEQLIKEVGLRPVCLGDLSAVAVVDGLTRLWFTLAFAQGRGRRIAFKLMEE
jgi:hypothetical protein